MELYDVVARMHRLDELSRGLIKESNRWNPDFEPLSFNEGKQYLKGILDALEGLEEARQTLARVCARLRQGGLQQALHVGEAREPG